MKRPDADVERFKRHDAESYDPVVATFDMFAERFTRPVAQRMVDLAGLSPGARVLDVATGTGVVAFEAARRLEAPGHVVGVDLSRGMVEAAAQKAARLALAGRVSFRVEDAERLSLPDASFDAVLSLYALMHFPRPDVALSEMRRVLRPGGTLVVGVGCAPPHASAAGLAHALRRGPSLLAERAGRALALPAFLDRLVGERLGSGAGPAQGPLAHAGEHPARAAPRLLRAAGFSEPRRAWHAGIGLLQTPEEAWDLASTFSSFARKRLDASPAEAVDALRRSFHDACRGVLSRGGRLLYPHSALLLRATAAVPRGPAAA